jgi:hypothetical protein
MNAGLAIVIASVIVAAAMLLGNRYAVVASDPAPPLPGTSNVAMDPARAWRLDRWTGAIWRCADFRMDGPSCARAKEASSN